MTDNKGKRQHKFSGDKGTSSIYCNVDSAQAVGEGGQQEWKKDRAIRKVIRTLIEANGGNGEEVKKKIDSNRQGIIWFRDERVAESKVEQGREGYMKLKGVMLEHEASFTTLMECKPKE